MKTLRLYSRPQCHLCEQMLEQLAPLLNETARVEIVDISEDLELLSRYRLRIPVLSCDGEEISQYPLDVERVRRILATPVD